MEEDWALHIFPRSSNSCQTNQFACKLLIHTPLVTHLPTPLTMLILRLTFFFFSTNQPKGINGTVTTPVGSSAITLQTRTIILENINPAQAWLIDNFNN